MNNETRLHYQYSITLAAELLGISPAYIESRMSGSESKIDNLYQTLQNLINTIKPREQDIINLRYGLLDSQWRLYKEVGAEIGVSKQRAYQVKQKAFRKLRHPSRSRKLRHCIEQGSGDYTGADIDKATEG